MAKPRSWGWWVLFMTSTTLLCCAIPIVLVTLGLGAVVASLAANAPWLIALSQYKAWLFALSGGLILGSLVAVYRPGRACPTDPELAAACAVADDWNRRLLKLSVTLWLLGLFAAYGLPLLFAA